MPVLQGREMGPVTLAFCCSFAGALRQSAVLPYANIHIVALKIKSNWQTGFILLHKVSNDPSPADIIFFLFLTFPICPKSLCRHLAGGRVWMVSKVCSDLQKAPCRPVTVLQWSSSVLSSASVSTHHCPTLRSFNPRKTTLPAQDKIQHDPNIKCAAKPKPWSEIGLLAAYES